MAGECVLDLPGFGEEYVNNPLRFKNDGDFLDLLRKSQLHMEHTRLFYCSNGGTPSLLLIISYQKQLEDLGRVFQLLGSLKVNYPGCT
jgi:hypothetical protein